MNKVEYILVHEYHDTYVDIYDNIELLRIALTNLKENYKNDNDFKYEIYCGKNVTEELNDLESKGE
jgi:hypothetical protein